MALDGDADLVLCIVIGGSLTVHTKGGKSFVCQPGDVYIGPTDPPGARVFHQPTTFVDIAVPLDLVTPVLAGFKQALVQQKVGSTQSSEWWLLANYVSMLMGAKKPLPPGNAYLAAGHVQDLIVMGLDGRRDGTQRAEQRGVRAARVSAIKADIKAHVTRPDLTIDRVAARHGITPQYVRSLLDSDGTTFTDFVRKERLRHVYRKLVDPDYADCKISTIALDAGFNDLSYFNRSFRRQYGMTPSGARTVQCVGPATHAHALAQ